MGVEEDNPGDKPPHGDTEKTDHKDGAVLNVNVSEVHQKAKIEQQTDHNHTVGQADEEGPTLKSGRRRVSHRNPENSREAKDKEAKYWALMRTALKQLLDRLEDIYRQIEAINQRLDEIDIEISELEHLKELAESGLLDPRNPDHAGLLKKYGITQEDMENGNLSAILAEKLGHRVKERTELQKRKEFLQHQADEAIAKAQADGIISLEEAEGFRRRMEYSEAGVSAQVRITPRASQELVDIAVQSHTEVVKDERVSKELDFSAASPLSRSVASSLEGDATYQKGIQSQGEPLSIQETFTAKAQPEDNTLELEEVASNSIAPGLKKG